MNIYVFDLEGDGLLDAINRIHCLCYHGLSGSNTAKTIDVETLTDLPAMRDWFSNADILIGHNIQRFDIPVVEKLLGIKVKAQLVDTLMLSWYLEPERVKHGLEEWGEELGIPKPPISDWRNLSVEEYIHRCSEDVKINTLLWQRFRRHLIRIYGTWDKVKPFLKYLEEKMDAAREQEASKWAFDKAYALESLGKLTEAKEEKMARLVAIMPTVPVVAYRSPPSKPFKKDGTLSVAGAKWQKLLKEKMLPHDHNEIIEEITSYTPANPASSSQVKDWLFSLGWKPETYKYVRDKDSGNLRKIPQINKGVGGGLCDSVLRLVDANPELIALADLGVVNHRLALLRGLLDFAGEGNTVEARVAGLTNTLRWKHSVCVNLPKVGRPWGEEVRGCLIAPDGYELCGADKTSLEDRLKQHYIYPYDPAYVEEMSTDDYDPHLSLAVLGGEISVEQMEAYKAGTDKSIKPIRDVFKNGNYACQYGAMPPRLALTANISLKKAEEVWEIYWKKNWAIKEVAESLEVKKVNGQMWLFNPVSQFWYSLRYEKDKFSTLIQGTAAYVFDRWVTIFRLERKQLTAQFHDEVVLCVKVGNRDKAENLLRGALDVLNKELNLNRELGIDVQFGRRYSEIH